jgi:spermidine dehydrogenase
MSGEKTGLDPPGGCPISRRDFLNGVAVTVGAGVLSGKAGVAGASPAAAGTLDAALRSEKGADPSYQDYFLAKGITEDHPAYYPPGLENMIRGESAGSFEAMHLLRDNDFWKHAGSITDTGETYDLIVIGAGISGLAAAHFFRQAAGANARILLLDNQDDFGGDAKRNEFRRPDGQLLLGYAGTQSIESPGDYSPQAMGLLKDLGIDVNRFYRDFDRKLYSSMGLRPAVFFDRETFGVDRLLPGAALQLNDDTEPVPIGRIDDMPIASEAKRDLHRLLNGKINYLPGLTGEQLRARLTRTSYAKFLTEDARAHHDVVRLFQQATHDLYCVGIDAVSALACQSLGYPGFKGIPLPQDDEEKEEPYIFHFPDGNASIARLLVRSLVPGSAPGHTMDDIVTAKMDYSRLDRPENPVRVRLNSTAVRARNIGGRAAGPDGAEEVEVAYVRQGRLYRVRGSFCVMGCFNRVVPYLCPEMPSTQKEALAYAVKEPLVYTNVQIRNWTAFQKLGINSIYCPGGYFSNIDLDFPVSIGGYRFPSSPEESCILHLLRTPCQPGLPCKEQYKAGRWDLFATPFAAFEKHVRDLLGRALAGGGFDPARDILAITVNRWPHGYAYEYNNLYEPLDRPEAEKPCVMGRKPFGRILIANSDSDGQAYTNVAIDQAYRAVREAMTLRGRRR